MRSGFKDLGGFRHEPHAAEGNHIARIIASLAGQFQAVAYSIGQVLNFAVLIMVRQKSQRGGSFSSAISSVMD